MEQRINDHVLKIIKGDLTELEVEAIVNAANAQLILGGGVAGAIRAKGGPAIQKECDLIGPIQVGEAAITGGGDLKAKKVIHAVGPRWGEGDEEAKLANAVKASLKLADQNGLKTIAFPAISTGIFGFPVERAARIILQTIKSCLEGETGLEEVVVCLFGEESFRVFAQAWEKMGI